MRSAEPRRHAAFVVALGLAISVQVSSASAQPAAVPIAHFSTPIFAAAPPGDSRLLVVERAGTIRVVDGDAVLPTPFLDISDRVSVPPDTEGSLLGLVFAADPQETILFRVDQPATNHNGGTIAIRDG